MTDAGHPLLQRFVDSLEILDGRVCWDFAAMYEVRDALLARAAALGVEIEPRLEDGEDDGV